MCTFIQWFTFAAFSAWFAFFAPVFLLASAALIYIFNRGVPDLGFKQKIHLKNSKLKIVSLLIADLCKKLAISQPPLVVLNKLDANVNLDACVQGFPLPDALFLSEDLLKIYKKKLTKSSMQALLAHELSHLKQQDPIFIFILNSLRVSLYTMSILFLVCSHMPLWWSLSLSLMLVLAQELFYAGFCRAKEALADLNAIKITNTPSVVRFIYDRYLQYLQWGKLVIENEFAAQTHFVGLSKDLETHLKGCYQKLTASNFRDTYHALEATTLQEKGILCQFQNHCKSWFNTHPTIRERIHYCECAQSAKP